MKKLILFALFLSGCATPVAYNHSEKCALVGMKLNGAQIQESAGTAYNWDSGTTTINIYSEGVNCSLPKTSEEACTINAWREVANPKVEYNEGIGAKKLITGVGYVIYIFPGLIAKIGFDSQAKMSIRKSMEIAKTAFQKCERAPASK